MAAYVLADIRVTNAQKFEQYKTLSAAAVNAYNGKFLVRGGEVNVVEGMWSPTRVTVIEFSTRETALAYVHSIQYGQAKAARKDAADFNMIIVHGV